MSSRRALLRHVWAMVQTRTEAAALVVQLQRSALAQGLLHYGIAALAAMSFVIAAIVLIAWRFPRRGTPSCSGLLAAALLAVAWTGASRGSARLQRDVSLIADFTQGLKLDLAMVNLALKDPDTEDEEKLAARERAKTAVREAAAAKARHTKHRRRRRATDARRSRHGRRGRCDRGQRGLRPTIRHRATQAASVDRARGADRRAATASAAVGGAYVSTATGAAGEALPDGVTEREMPGVAPPESLSGATQADRERSHGST